MSGAHRRGKGGVSRLGIAIVAAVALLGCTAAASVASPPRDPLKDFCWEKMSDFMEKRNSAGYADAVRAGLPSTYQDALDGVKIVVDPNLKSEYGREDPNAQWDPTTRTITLKDDPLLSKNMDLVGQTVWHEVTHVIQYDNSGDFILTRDPEVKEAWVERNTWFMEEAWSHLEVLNQMEKLAAKGASANVLALKWDAFTRKMYASATNGQYTKMFPPDSALMKKWFGFAVRADLIAKSYLTDPRFKGKKWANLRKAIRMETPKADASMSRFKASGALSIKADGVSTTSLGVYAYDEEDNYLGVGGAKVKITQVSGEGTLGPTADNGNGSYIAVVTSPAEAGSGVFVATLDGDPVEGGSGRQIEITITYEEDTSPDGDIAVGQPYQGGIVAYLLVPGDPGYDSKVPHGLIAAVADQTPSDSLGLEWATEPRWYTPAGCIGTAIGTGAGNTAAIIAQNGTGGTYAAGLARAYTTSLFSDWYLPSKDELNKLYLNRIAIGGFDTVTFTYYWSSSEVGASESDACYAWCQYFGGGEQVRFTKGHMTARVRAIRSF